MIGPKDVSLAKEEAPERYKFLCDVAIMLLIITFEVYLTVK